MELKADLHLHTQEGDGFIAYDARGLIRQAEQAGFSVLSVTNHNVVTFSQDLQAYARERGILLIGTASEMWIPKLKFGRVEAAQARAGRNDGGLTGSVTL